MEDFYCRERELGKLQERYEENEFECLIIYGRRRVGKTALINKFCEGKPTIFFSAVNTTALDNLRYLSKSILSYERPNETAGISFDSFDSAFEEITRLSLDHRLIFVIDEYPYLAKAHPVISSVLQHLIDHKWNKTKLYLILCGSSVSFMENQVLGQESPLYGRRTGQFRLEPLDYRDTAVFHPELSCEENALVYGITGGVPHYINKLGIKGDLDKALLKNLFDRSSYLYEEPANLLKQELREPGLYNAVIRAIAEGASRLSEICAKVGESSTTTTKYIKILMELGIIKKETPITEKPGKKTIYLLADNFFRFWYRFVPENMSAIDSGRIQETYETGIRQHFPDYMGLVFEKMCKEYLLYYAQELPINLNQVGQWWGTDPKEKKPVQIDMIGTSVNGREFIVGSCKYRNEKIGLDELEFLRKYAAAFGKGERYHYYIFSKGGFTKGLLDAGERGEVTLITLEELYENRTLVL